MWSLLRWLDASRQLATGREAFGVGCFDRRFVPGAFNAIENLSNILQAVSDTQRLLLVTTGQNEIIRRSARNLADVEVQTADLLNPLQITGARHLLFTKDAAQRVDEIWNAPATRPARRAIEA